MGNCVCVYVREHHVYRMNMLPSHTHPPTCLFLGRQPCQHQTHNTDRRQSTHTNTRQCIGTEHTVLLLLAPSRNNKRQRALHRPAAAPQTDRRSPSRCISAFCCAARTAQERRRWSPGWLGRGRGRQIQSRLSLSFGTDPADRPFHLLVF